MQQESRLTRFVGEHSLTNGTRPHSELGELSSFRMARQVFAQAALVHVVFATHRTRMVGRPAFGHVRPGANIGIVCKTRT